jgi:hypothetical protein
MKIKHLITTAFLLTLTGCFFGSGGPSDAEIKKLVTSSIEGGMDAFCPSPEVLSVDVIRRGNAVERSPNRTDFPVTVEVEKKCGSNMFSRGETKDEDIKYNFWLNSYGEWRFSRSSGF